MPSYPRNVDIYDPTTQPPSVVAGVNQHGSLKISTFYTMLNMVQDRWIIYKTDNHLHMPLYDGLNPDNTAVLPIGNYIILSPNKRPVKVSLTKEWFPLRTLSLDRPGKSQNDTFRKRVQGRDMGCCVTGKRVVQNKFHPFRTTHIFAVAHKDTWDMMNLPQYIEDDVSEAEQDPSSINSVQNGFPLRSDIHDMFDAYDFAINPDDDYRTYDFTSEGELEGKALWFNTNVDAKYRPSDHLLREHYRQCVLANVKGAGKRSEDWIDPEDQQDLSNFNTWGKRLGDDGPSRLELEVASRLYRSGSPFIGQ